LNSPVVVCLTDKGSSTIRVAAQVIWDSGDGFSEEGTDAKGDKNYHEATMSLPKTSDYSSLKMTTLHEFGHMLGALHEQFNPSFPYKWNKAAIINSIETDLRVTGDDNGNEWDPHELKKKGDK